MNNQKEKLLKKMYLHIFLFVIKFEYYMNIFFVLIRLID